MSRAIALVFLFAACDPAAVDPVDPGKEEPPFIGPAVCEDAPVTTYDNFGAGFLTQHCLACHAATAPNRNDAPVDVTFDTEEQVWQWADRMLVRAAGDAPTMPPQGGVSEDDRYLLEVWLTCAG